MSYHGWTNNATWNIALWVSNDETLYKLARSTEGSYRDFACILLDEFQLLVTPDLESFHGRDLDDKQLDMLLKEIRED